VLLPLLVITIPLEFTEMYLPFGFIQVSRLVITACLVTLLIQRVFRVGDVSLPPVRLWLPPVCFIGYSAVSAALSGSVPGLKTVAAMVVYGFLALAVYNWSGTLADQDRFWTWLTISVIAVAIVGLVGGLTGTHIWNAPDEAGLPRVNATFRDPNILARFLAFGTVAAVVLASRARVHWRLLFVAAIVLASATMPFTFSRQGWVLGGLVLGVAFVLATNRWRALALGAVAIGSFAVVVGLEPQVRERANVLGQILTTQPPHVFDGRMLAFVNLLPLDSARRYLVAAGFQMFFDHPIFGVGFGNFPASMLGHYRDFIVPQFTTIDSHSSFVTIIAEQGLVGFALATWWAFEFVRSTARSARLLLRRPYLVAAVLALLLILLASQFEGRLLQEPYAWLFLGVALGAQKIEDASEPALSDASRAAQLVELGT
jgi:O-antigen ligase